MREIILVAFALTAAVFDIKTRRIPNYLILAMLAVWLLLMLFELINGKDTVTLRLAESILGCAVGGGIFLAVYFISRGGLGGGDVKFIAVAGLHMGLSGTVPAILLGTVLAALTGLTLILLKKISRKDKLPLAPFLLAGIVITVLL